MNLNFCIQKKEIIKRLLKYIIIGLAVAFATDKIPKNKIDDQDIIMIAITASCVFAIIDMYAPTIDTNTIINIEENN
jgi:hypothetical protein